MQRKKFDVTRLYEHVQPGLNAAFPSCDPVPAEWQELLSRLDGISEHGPIRRRLVRLKSLLDAEGRGAEVALSA